MSCTDVDAGRPWGASDPSAAAGVLSPDPSPSFSAFSSVPLPLDSAAGLGAPKAKGSDFTGPLPVSASGVLGGLPKPKPTGFPMLPALGKPLKRLAFAGDAEPKEKGLDEADFSGVLVANGLEPVEPEPKKPPEDEVVVVDAGASFSSGLSASFSLVVSEGLPNVLPPKMEEDELEGPKKEVGPDEVDDVGPFPNKEEPDEGAPNEKGDGALEPVVGAVNEPLNEKLDLGASDAGGSEVAGLEPKLNGLARVLELLVSDFGAKPELVDDPDDVGATRGLNPEKLAGGAGMVKLGAEGGLVEASVLLNIESEGALLVDGALEGADADVDLSSRLASTETRSALYRSSMSATSANGSASMAFEMAERSETFKPRMAL